MVFEVRSEGKAPFAASLLTRVSAPDKGFTFINGWCRNGLHQNNHFKRGLRKMGNPVIFSTCDIATGYVIETHI